MNIARKIWGLMEGSRRLYALGLVFVALAAGVNMLVPLIIRYIVDTLLDGQPADLPGFVLGAINRIGGEAWLRGNLWLPGLAIVMVFVVQGFFLYLRSRFVMAAAEDTTKTLRDRLYNHIQRLPYSYHIKAQTGDLVQRCTTDVNHVRNFLAGRVTELVIMVFFLGFAIVFMLSLDITLTFISISMVPVIIGFSSMFYRDVTKIYKEWDEKEAELHTVLQENLSGVRVVRAFGREAYEIQKFEAKNTELHDITILLNNKLAFFWSVSNGVSLLQYGIVVVAAIHLNYTGQVSVGTFMAFITYINIFLWPIRNLGRILADAGQTRVSIERLEEVFNAAQEEDGSIATPSLRGDIVFDDVRFGFGGMEVLRGISFCVKSGQTAGILGATGSGKSTLMHLLVRLYEPQAGSITIGGVPINTISKYWLRSKIGIVLQETFLYSKTIFENLKMAKQQLASGEAERAAKIANVHRDIKRFDKRYNTIVGEKGVTLSGGQKQRVSIARTIIKESEILIFDDSLSAVDSETDLQIRQALKQRRAGVTTFIISQRITTLMDADVILVLENGRLADRGSHEELITREGLYSKIWEINNQGI